MPYLFIFDLHNTLVKDNDLVVVNAMNLVLSNHKKNARVDIEYVRNYQAMLKPFVQYFRSVLPDAPEHEIEEMTFETKELCEKFLIKQYIKKMNGAEKVLQQIKKTGDTVYVLSFSTTESMGIYLQAAGLSTYVDKMLGIETIQEMRGNYEPAKVKTKLLENQLGANKTKYDKIFMIGDSVHDMKAGKSVGAINIYFTNTSEVLDIADYSIDKLEDIIKIAYSKRASTGQILATLKDKEP
jgi:phosphoglycolate phosphatase-like HAD superfamily hydrolase